MVVLQGLLVQWWYGGLVANQSSALHYIESIDLRGIPRGIVAHDANADAGPVFDQAKNQAQVVGSALFSFAQGIDAVVREAISDSALLAQLVANKDIAFDQDPEGWFKAYLTVLGGVGWTVQDGGWSDYTTTGTGAEVNEQILPVITAALAPTAAALTIITAAVNALKAMESASPWFTIFSRETTKAKIGRFQIGLTEKGADDQVFVSLIAFVIVANSDLTQLLFFKFREAGASFKANASKVSVNCSSVIELGPAVRNKVRAYQLDYISKLVNL